MNRAALALILIGLTAAPALAQGRGNARGKNKQGDSRERGVPAGHLPPPGECRVWYDGVPPGQQPPPLNCDKAERIASRDRDARVIYGSNARRSDAPIYREADPRYPGDVRRDDDYGRYPGDVRRDDGDRRYPSTDGRRPNPDGRTTGRNAGRDQYPNSYPSPDARNPRGGYSSEAFRKGYEDGMFKGREDVDDRDSFDPARHSWYRSADRGYNSRYGSREEYRSEYRRGFLDGYQSAHDGRQRSRSGWWPF
jgi:hypothetical protein